MRPEFSATIDEAVLTRIGQYYVLVIVNYQTLLMPTWSLHDPLKIGSLITQKNWLMTPLRAMESLVTMAWPNIVS